MDGTDIRQRVGVQEGGQHLGSRGCPCSSPKSPESRDGPVQRAASREGFSEEVTARPRRHGCRGSDPQRSGAVLRERVGEWEAFRSIFHAILTKFYLRPSPSSTLGGRQWAAWLDSEGGRGPRAAPVALPRGSQPLWQRVGGSFPTHRPSPPAQAQH